MEERDSKTAADDFGMEEAEMELFSWVIVEAGADMEGADYVTGILVVGMVAAGCVTEEVLQKAKVTSVNHRAPNQ